MSSTPKTMDIELTANDDGSGDKVQMRTTQRSTAAEDDEAVMRRFGKRQQFQVRAPIRISSLLSYMLRDG